MLTLQKYGHSLLETKEDIDVETKELPENSELHLTFLLVLFIFFENNGFFWIPPLFCILLLFCKLSNDCELERREVSNREILLMFLKEEGFFRSQVYFC